MPPYSPELNPVENAWQYLRQNFLSNRENYETIPTRRNGLTKTGDTEARRVMVEAAWTYRLLARVGRILLDRLEGLPV